MIAYGAMLDVPRELVGYVSRLLAAQRRARGTRTRTRALTCRRQALFVLVWFRKREDLTVLGAGFGISRATACRYRDEAVRVLADRLRVKTISRKRETIDLWYSGKRHDFGGNIQAVMRPDGLPIRVSAVEPGSVHDLAAAHEHALGALYATAARGLPTLADPGYAGAGIGVHTPFKQPTDGRQLGLDNRTYNALLRSLRCLGERGFALLVGRWRILQHVTACPKKIGDLAIAALVLTQFEHGYVYG